MRHHTTTILLLALLLLFATGCGGNRDAGPVEPTPTSTQASDPEPIRGGEFRIPLAGITTLDPPASTNVNEGFAIHQIFQGLVKFDWRLRVVPDLALSWSLSPDQKTYTFELDPNATFHNGRPVTSDDVLFSFRRVLDPGMRSILLPLLSGVLDGGVDAVTSDGPHRCSIRIHEPDHVFIKLLAMQQAKIVPRGTADEPGFNEEPVGSGPFQVNRKRGKRFWLKAFRPNGSETPYLDSILLLDFDSEEEQNAVKKKEVDYVVVAPGDTEQFELDRFERVTVTPLTIHFLGMNISRPPFDDPRVRRAFSLAINQEKIAEASENRITAASSILPPGMPGHTPGEVLYPYDPARARDLLGEAGFGPDGVDFPEIKILLGRMPHRNIIQEELVESFKEIGVPVKIKIVDNYPTYIAYLKKVEVAMIGWGADYPDPDSFLNNLFRTGSPQNILHYSNPELDELLQAARHGEVTKVRRWELYKKAARLLADDCPVVPLFHDAALHCIHKRVRGLVPNPLGIYTTRLDTVWLDDVEP